VFERNGERAFQAAYFVMHIFEALLQVMYNRLFVLDETFILLLLDLSFVHNYQ
jgi:hypothetical protein